MAITVAFASFVNDSSLMDMTNREFIVDGTLTLSGTYPTNGDTLSLVGVAPGSQLTKMEIWENTPATNAPASGYAFVFLPGTTLANGLMEMFNGTTQVTTQAYASLSLPTNFALRFRAWFFKEI